MQSRRSVGVDVGARDRWRKGVCEGALNVGCTLYLSAWYEQEGFGAEENCELSQEWMRA